MRESQVVTGGVQGDTAVQGAVETVSLRRLSQGAVLLVASVGALLAFLDATIVNVVFPAIRQSFPGSTLGGLSWVLNAYNIVFAAFLVAAGRLADLFGRRRTFTTGVLLFTVSSVVCGLAPSVGVLVAGRLFQAAGAALLVPASIGLVIAASPPERRSHAVGIWGATAAVAAGLGPPLGGALVAAGSWRLAFLINVPIGLGAVAAGSRTLVESRTPGVRTLPDLRGACLQAAAVGLLTLGIVQGGTWGWTSPAVLASFAAALAAGALSVESSRRHPSPVLDRRLLRVRSFAVANVVTLVAGIGFYAYLLNNILWLHYVWGWSLLLSGLAVAPAALVAAVAAGVLGRVADRRGHRLFVAAGAVVWAAAFVWYATQVGTHPDFLGEWLPAQVLSGVGSGATLSLLVSAAVAAVPGGGYATASAVVTSARQLGGVFGVALLVVVIGSASGAALPGRLRDGWLLSAGCFAFAAAAALLLRPERDQVAQGPETELQPRVDLRPRVASRRPSGGSLVQRLPERARGRLRDLAEPVALPAGDWLFREGDTPDALYLVEAGRLEVVAGDEVLAELVAGDVVGELGLLAGTPRGASVRARRDAALLRVPAESFHAVLREDADAQRALTAGLAAQIQRSRVRDPDPPPGPRVVSVVDLDGSSEPAAAALAAALARRLDVAVPERVDAAGLDRLEREHDRVLLHAGAGADEEWRRFCLRQADRLVFVAGAAAAPPADMPACPSYVLLCGEAPVREAALAWHDAVGPRRVVACDGSGLADAVDGLAARLAGASVGLALAGGGARAFAAIGVLEELDRAGIRVDRIAGSSVGAFVAALHALGYGPAEIDAVCYEEYVRRNPFDYTLPRFSLARGRRLKAGLARQFGERRFEELPRELVVVSTNLLDRSPAVHRRGLVRDAVGASVSLPGLFPPARIGNELHIDGGVLDNLPVAALAADEGPVVALDIGAATSLRREGPPRLPPLSELLLRSVLIGGAGAHRAARERAAVVVTPDTRGIGLLEFHQIDRAVEAGRAAGAAAVVALRELEAAP